MDDRIKIAIKLIDGCCYITVNDKTYEIEYKDDNENLLSEDQLLENIKKYIDPEYNSKTANGISKITVQQMKIFFDNHPISPNESCIFTSYQPSKSNSFIENKSTNLTTSSDLKKSFWDNYISEIEFDFDDVYILSANSGEINAFVAYLAETVFKKNGSKNPLIVATKNYHKDIVEMYLPNYNSVYYDCYLFTFGLRDLGASWEYNDHNIYIMYSANHFSKVNCFGLKNYYYNAIVDYVGLSYTDSQVPNWTIKQEIKDSVLKKIEHLNLDIDNFVILTPEAATFSELKPEFWNEFSLRLKDIGLSTFFNISKFSNDYTKDGEFPILSYQEIFYLATLSKAIVSLRSGLTEFLIPTNTPLITLFSCCWNNPVEETRPIYSVMDLPHVTEDKVSELYTQNYSNTELLIEEIIEKIKSIKDRKFSF